MTHLSCGTDVINGSENIKLRVHVCASTRVCVFPRPLLFVYDHRAINYTVILLRIPPPPQPADPARTAQTASYN